MNVCFQMPPISTFKKVKCFSIFSVSRGQHLFTRRRARAKAGEFDTRDQTPAAAKPAHPSGQEQARTACRVRARVRQQEATSSLVGRRIGRGGNILSQRDWAVQRGA
jgi:hypothetical protein